MFDPQDPHPAAPLLRLLNASFRLTRLAGTEVRMFYVALVVTPLVLTEGTEWMTGLERLGYVALITVALFVTILAHEFGHVAAGWRYGIVTPVITLSPLGGLAHMSANAPGPKAEVRVALMGPATHLSWLIVLLPLCWWVVPEPGDGWMPEGARLDFVHLGVHVLADLNLGLLAFNLLPFFPMDGGRVLRALLAMRMHPNRATLLAVKVGFVGGGLFIVAGIIGWATQGGLMSTVLLLIGISNVLACVQERRAARYSAGPYMDSGMRSPWESDGDAWKRGTAHPQVKRAGVWARWRARRATQRTVRAAQAADALQQEVDRILDKVRAQGMSSLSTSERTTLERASDAWRR